MNIVSNIENGVAFTVYLTGFRMKKNKAAPGVFLDLELDQEFDADAIPGSGLVLPKPFAMLEAAVLAAVSGGDAVKHEVQRQVEGRLTVYALVDGEAERLVCQTKALVRIRRLHATERYLRVRDIVRVAFTIPEEARGFLAVFGSDVLVEFQPAQLGLPGVKVEPQAEQADGTIAPGTPDMGFDEDEDLPEPEGDPDFEALGPADPKVRRRKAPVRKATDLANTTH